MAKTTLPLADIEQWLSVRGSSAQLPQLSLPSAPTPDGISPIFLVLS